MKKLLQGFLLLISFIATAQTIPPDATQLENIQITNNTTSTTAVKMVVQENNGVLNTMPFAGQDNISKFLFVEITEQEGINEIVSRANAIGYTVTEIQSIWIKVIIKDVLGEEGLAKRVDLYKVVEKGKGSLVLGAGYTNLLYVSSVAPNTGSFEDLTTQTINTGANISGSNISAYVNALSPAIAIQSQSEGYVLFKVLNGTTPQTYLFLSAGGIYGAGQLQTTLSDFQLLDSSPAPVVPNLQQITDAGNTTSNPIFAIISNPSNNGIITNGNIGGRALQLGNGAVIEPEAIVVGSRVLIDAKIAYKNTVGTTYTGREHIDADFGNATYAKLSGGNSFSGNQMVSSGQFSVSNPAGTLFVGSNTADTDFVFSTTSAGAATKFTSIESSVTNRALMLNNTNGGNVGIGKNGVLPTEKLDVSGNVKANNLITNDATASNHAVALGQIKTAIKSVTATTTLTLADYGADKELLVLCSASGGAFSVNIPASSTILGYKTRIIKTDSSVNAVTADANGSELINQATTFVLTAQNQVIQLESNSTQLYITN